MTTMIYIKNTAFTLLVLVTLQVSAQKILTKNEALKIALENNYGVKIAANNVIVSKNNSSIYNSRYLPTISTNAGANYSNQNQEIESQSGNITKVNGAETKSFNASINVNYTIFDGLGRKYTYKQLKESYNLSELQAREAIEDMHLQLFNSYFQIARLSESTKNLQRTLNISKQRLKRAKYQYEYGQTTKLELLNAQVDVNNDSINLINSNQEFSNSKRNLNIVLGIQKSNNYDVETNVEFNTLYSYDELLTKAKENNVLLKQNQSNIAISQFNIKANKAGFLPTVGLSSSYGWNKNINPTTSFTAETNSLGLNAGVNLSWNIFDGGSTKTRVANAKIALDNQQIGQQQQIDLLENEVKNTFELYQNKLFILEAQKQNEITSQNNLDRTQERYKLGQITSIEFRQAQLNLLNTQNAVNNAQYDAKLIELELLQLSGDILNVQF